MVFHISEPTITVDLLEDSQTDTDSVVVVYTEETGASVFDHYIFSINGPRSTPVVKTKTDERVVKFKFLDAGNLYTVTAWSVSGSEISRKVIIQIRTGELV